MEERVRYLEITLMDCTCFGMSGVRYKYGLEVPMNTICIAEALSWRQVCELMYPVV